MLVGSAGGEDKAMDGFFLKLSVITGSESFIIMPFDVSQ